MKNRITTIKFLQKFIYHGVFVLHFFWILVGTANANNIQVSNISLTGKNTTSDFVNVKFNLSWENSWRTSSAPNNWDAAWVFVKFRVGASDPTFTNVTCTNGSPNITMPDVSNLRVGMPVVKTAGSSNLPANAVITAINTTTKVITLSGNIGTTSSNNTLVFTRIWEHAFLNNTGHIAVAGSIINAGLLTTGSAFNPTTNPALGVFVYRSSNGTGTNNFTNTELRWNYGANGLPDNFIVSVRVFAIEMVYVPSGAFQVGDGTTTDLRGQFRNGSTNTPFPISSENALTLGGTSNGNLANNNASGMITADDFNNTTTRTLPASFPKGFNAFYCMKYELSQQQWIDFFNSLTSIQKGTRDITLGPVGVGGKNSDGIVRRNNIRYTTGDATLSGGTFGNVSCNYLSWMDHAAFADWSGLRPMTELEFEKACRGPLTPVVNEWAAGVSSATVATGITNSGANNEVASNAGANLVFNSSTGGPLRVGNFAKAGTTRAQAGASYYGIMELSGNNEERCIPVGNTTARNFTASIHGNGLLTVDGFCDISTWPGFVTNKISGATGSGTRGGNWENPLIGMRVSDRWGANHPNDWRNANSGIRAVRSAP